MRTLAFCAAALLLSACSTPTRQAPAPQPVPPAAAAQPAPIDPVGVYDFSTDVQGTAVSGVITIRKNERGELTGAITTDMTGEMPVSKVTVDGKKMQVRASTPDGELVINVEFVAEKFTGNWDMAGAMSGSLTGSKRKT